MKINEVLSEGFFSSFVQNASLPGGLGAGTSFPQWYELEKIIDQPSGATGNNAQTIRNQMKPQANTAAAQMTTDYMGQGATIMKTPEDKPPRSWQQLTPQEKTNLLDAVLENSTQIMFKKSFKDLLAGATTPDQKQAVNNLSQLRQKLLDIDIASPNAKQNIQANFVAQCLELFVIAMGQSNDTSVEDEVAGTKAKSLGLALDTNPDGSMKITLKGQPIDTKNPAHKSALVKLFKS